jgi:hypothetical protein
MRNGFGSQIGLGLLCGVLLTATAAAAGAQPSAPSGAETAVKELKTLALVGCVVRDPGAGPLRLADGYGGAVELQGGDLNSFVGKKVRIVGTGDSRKLSINFGLYPSPNIAAQAGGISPVRAAEAAMPGGAAHGTGNVTLPELRVKIIRTLPGSCP